MGIATELMIWQMGWLDLNIEQYNGQAEDK